MLEAQIRSRLRGHRGYRAIQAINGIGPTMAAILVAEIGDVTRFRSAPALCSWAGLTPKHAESDTNVRRGGDHQARIAARALGGDRGHRPLSRRRETRGRLPRIAERRGKNKATRRDRPQGPHPRLLRPARRRDPLPRAGAHEPLGHDRTRARNRHDLRTARRRSTNCLSPSGSWPERTTLPPVSEGMPGSRACPPQIDEPWCGTRQPTITNHASLQRGRAQQQRTSDQHNRVDTAPLLQECRSRALHDDALPHRTRAQNGRSPSRRYGTRVDEPVDRRRSVSHPRLAAAFLSSAIFMAAAPAVIISSTTAASSSGLKSAVHTTTVVSSACSIACAEPL